MYNIEKTDYGYKITFGGDITTDEMKKWVKESKQVLDTEINKFSVFIDMRELKPIPKDTQTYLEEGQKLYKQKGLERSIIILKETETTTQFKRIGKETGADKWERYIDASSISNWEQIGLDWIIKAVDPEQVEATT